MVDSLGVSYNSKNLIPKKCTIESKSYYSLALFAADKWADEYYLSIETIKQALNCIVPAYFIPKSKLVS